jgi:hypothetical protein
MVTDIFGNRQIRMLAWKPPYGTAMLYGKVETRSWDTAFRGEVLIYNSLEGFTTDKLIDLAGSQYDHLMQTVKDDPTVEMFGMAFAIGELVYTRQMKQEDEDRTFVQYKPDEIKYCHFYNNVKRIQPFPIKGNITFPSLLPTKPEHSKIINQIKILENGTHQTTNFR